MVWKFRKWMNLSFEEKKLFAEAYVVLGVMRAAILVRPFKKLTRPLQHSAQKGTLPVLDEWQEKKAVAIGRTIERAAAHTPWESACLAQSLTAWKMLQRRGIPGMFFLGVAKGEKAEEKMRAHAWTRCGEMILTGKRGHEAFTVVSVFEWK